MLKKSTALLTYLVLAALFLSLLVLKLLGLPPVAAWSWWRVTAPLWAPWAAALVLAAGLLLRDLWTPPGRQSRS